MKRAQAGFRRGGKARFVAVAALLLAWGVPAHAQQFPERPIHLIVVTAAGGTTDLTAREYGRFAEPRLGQPIIVENRTGASGTIAGNYVRTAPPDGYTLLVGGLGMSSVFVKTNSIEVERDLLPVSTLTSGAFFVFVRDSLPVKSMQDLIAYAKANPGKLNYGTSASITLLDAEALKLRTGILFTAIPYRGAAPIVPAMLANEVDFTIDSLPTFAPHVQSGKVRVLMVATPNRSTALPNVPTAAELGITDYAAGFYIGLWAPLKTPNDAIRRLASETAIVMRMPEVVEFMRNQGSEAVGSTPEELLTLHKAFERTLADAAKASHYEPQ
jgi:tripartite-type tricarboxylate transporter receptor subunit TctC